MPENHTIPDPHLTREEAKRVYDVIEAGLSEDTVETPAPFELKTARDKLRNSLSAPLVEDGGVEKVLDQLERWMVDYEGEEGGPVETKLSWITGPDGDPTTQRPDAGDYLVRLRDVFAAIPPFLGQGEVEALRAQLRAKIESFRDHQCGSKEKRELLALLDAAAVPRDRGPIPDAVRDKLRPASIAHLNLVAAVLECLEKGVYPETIHRFVDEELSGAADQGAAP